jgi:hypothetical protein
MTGPTPAPLRASPLTVQGWQTLVLSIMGVLLARWLAASC